MTATKFRWSAVLLLLLTGPDRLSVHAADTATKFEFALQPAAPARFQRVELQIHGVPAHGNPFDPDSIALDLEVVSPSGRRTAVPGFLLHDFERRIEAGREALTPTGEDVWRVRWLPAEAGRHQLNLTLRLDGAVAARSSTTCDVADRASRGIVRVEPTARRHFQFTDGTPLFLNGLCACWHHARGTFDYDDWLGAYERSGMNYIRIWMWPEAFGIEWDRGDRLHYRLDNAWRLDRVLAEAERRNVLVMLCLDYHGIFEVKPDFWGGNNYWTRHPYNVTNGGPCRVQNEFFTGAEARRLYEKRLRYVVARWSAFPNLLAWEFFNEIDNEYAYLRHDDVMAWHRDMARHLRALDPVGHLITSSFTGGSEKPGLYDQPDMDFSQYHSYNEQHPARMTARKTAKFSQQYGRPFFVSEYGTDWRGWKPDTDPHFRALHQAVWSAAFTGAAGTGMTWWWEQIHAANLYRHWSALAAFLRDTSIGRPELAPARFAGTNTIVTPYGLASRDEALVWLLDPACDWPEGAKLAEPPPVGGATVWLEGVADGRWKVEWWDTLEGRRVADTETAATNGVLRLEPPPFRADIAARLKRR